MVAYVTPVDQDDKAVIALIETTEQVLGYDPGNPGAGHGPSNKFLQAIANTLLFLRNRVGVVGSWDLSSVVTPVEPDNALNSEATWTKTDNDNYEMTPVAGASNGKAIGSQAFTFPTTARYQRVLQPGAGGGSNLAAIALMITNAGATAADAMTTLLGSTPTGTCTHCAGVVFDHSGGFGGVGVIVANKVISGSSTSSALTATFTPGTTDAHVGCHISGSDLIITYDDGVAPVETKTLTNFATGLTATGRTFCLGYFASTTPTVAGGTINLDFGDSSGGRAPLAVIAAPSLPANAADGKRYLVTGAGSYGGRSAAAGDVVELHSGTTLFNVLPAVPMTSTAVDALIAAYLAANPQFTLLMEARNRQYCIDIANDVAAWPGTRVRGDVVIVGSTPAGGWSAYAAYSVMVYDGAAWVNYPALSFRGVKFAWAEDGLRHARLQYLHSGATFDNEFTTDSHKSLGNAAVTAATLLASGYWLFSYDNTSAVPINDTGLSAVGGASMNLDMRLPAAYVQVTGTGIADIAATNATASFERMVVRLSKTDAGTCVVRFFNGGAFPDSITLQSGEAVDCLVVREGYYENEIAVRFLGGRRPVGHLHMTGNATTTAIAVAGTYYKAAGTTTADALDLFSHSNNRLTYDGAATKQFKFDVAASILSGSNNQLIGIQIALNGTPVAGSKMRGKVLAAGDPTNLHCTDVFDMAPGDYVEVFVTNETGTNALTVEELQMSVLRVGC